MKKTLIVLIAGVAVSPVMAAFELQNGAMEDPFSSNVAVPWTYYSGGTMSGVAQAKSTTTVHGGLSSQRLAGNATNNAANLGIRQTIETNIGDALTFGGWVWPDAAGTYNETSIRVAWDGGTTAGTATVLSSWLPGGTQRQQWHDMGLGTGNATATSVTLFLHSRRYSSNGSLLTYWDDVVGYHAYVPPAPSVSNVTGTTAVINVNPGDNQANASAQFALTITGGAYGSTEGVYWVGALGNVSTTKVFLTDADWGAKTVSGLDAGITYTVKALARYSATTGLRQETYLGAPATIPEPAALALFGIAGLMLHRRR